MTTPTDDQIDELWDETTIPTDDQIDELWNEIGGYFNLYPEVRNTIREALNRWRTLEPIALKDREPQFTDLDEDGYCWWWDRVDDVWERMEGDDMGILTINRINKKLDSFHQYTHWVPGWAIKRPTDVLINSTSND